MAIELNEEVKNLLRDPAAAKILTTADSGGELHIVSDPSITLNDEGQIVYLELLETSQSNANLVSSLWFKRRVALYASSGGTAYLIKGYPVRSVISGPLFTRYYSETVKRNPDDDLSTVWLIEPEEVSNESYAYRKLKEREEHPLVMHLDRLAK